MQVLPAVKPAFSQIMQAYYRHQDTNLSKNDVMSAITKAVVCDMTSKIEEVGERVVDAKVL